MSIKSYFKPVSSLPMSEETRVGAFTTREANRSMQRVLEANNLRQND